MLLEMKSLPSHHSYIIQNKKGGNQRELARKKGASKAADAQKGLRKDGVSEKNRKEHDAEILRAKQKAAEERKKAEELAKTKKWSRPLSMIHQIFYRKGIIIHSRRFPLFDWFHLLESNQMLPLFLLMDGLCHPFLYLLFFDSYLMN